MKFYKAPLLALLCASYLSGIQQSHAADDLKYGGKSTTYDANLFGYISFAPSAKGKELMGYKFDDTNYIGIGGGAINKKPMGIGLYGEIKGTPTVLDINGNSDFVYDYTIVNVGLTLRLHDRFVLMGGVGYSHEDAKFTVLGTHYESNESNSNLNVNVGALLQISSLFGVVLAFDSAASAYSLGLAVTF
jgi:hypothetical protein